MLKLQCNLRLVIEIKSQIIGERKTEQCVWEDKLAIFYFCLDSDSAHTVKMNNIV